MFLMCLPVGLEDLCGQVPTQTAAASEVIEEAVSYVLMEVMLGSGLFRGYGSRLRGLTVVRLSVGSLKVRQEKEGS